MQIIVVAGNLGGNPEMKYMSDGTAVTNFSLATREYGGKGDDGESLNNTYWWRITVWGKRGEAANQYLVKGQKVTVRGRMKGDNETGSPRIYARQDGTSGTSFEITADEIEYGSKPEGVGTSPQSQTASTLSTPAEEDNIPF